MYSFYGGQKGQDFKITRIFSNRAVDMLGDLKMRWTSPVAVGDYVFISYGDPSFMNEDTSTYNTNLQLDLKDSGKSYTNSLWQKIYVDRNLTISPDFPQNDNNVYIFLNLDESMPEEYGESLKEVSDIESEENFGFAYRLIACVTGVTPRIQVFHQTIDIEDGDPYVTLDLLNPDTPKIKFYLQRGQRIEDVYKNVVGPQENPDARLITDGRTYVDKNGITKKATLTRPQLIFDLPKVPSFYSGMLFGQGALPYFHNMGKLINPTAYATTEVYKIYDKESSLIAKISQFIYEMLIEDTVSYTLNSSTSITINDKKHFFYSKPDGYKNEVSQYGTSNIFVQDDYKVLFYPYMKDGKRNDEALAKVQTFYKDLLNNYNITIGTYLSTNEKGEQISSREYYWQNTDDVNESEKSYLLSLLIERSFPGTLYPLGTIIYNLFKFLMAPFTDDGSGILSSYNFETFTIDDYFTASYLVNLLNRTSLLSEHYYDLTEAFEGDYYINEPTGKIYMLSYISKKYVEGKYIGTITAPAPYATVENVTPFILKDGAWVRNELNVRSNVNENTDTRMYQEEFIFSVPVTPLTSINIKNVDNGDAARVTGPYGAEADVQQIDVDMPMPIHILTPSSTEAKLSINSGKVVWDTTKPCTILFGRGDLFLNIVDADSGDSYRGQVYRYNADAANSLDDQKKITNFSNNWNLIGSINGTPGIPVAKKIVNITLVTDSASAFSIKYNGYSVAGYNYNINKAPGNDTMSLTTIIEKILTSDSSLGKTSSGLVIPTLTTNINSSNGDIVLINYYSDAGAVPQSYWGIYGATTDNITTKTWTIMAFSGGSSSFVSTKVENSTSELAKSQGYSVNYVENGFITDHFSWHEV